MKKVLVRYKVKSDRANENEDLIKAVYRQLAEEKIEGFHYCTLRVSNTSFVHIAFSKTKAANDRFADLTSFKKFQANIGDRCEETPVVEEVTMIGSYNFLLHVPDHFLADNFSNSNTCL